jgi:ribokinase
MSGAPRQRGIVVIGGIGTGSFFLLDGNHTLGREESRGGRYLDRRDYCKGHIVAHYLTVLLDPAVGVRMIGAVGDDQAGRTLLAEMGGAGIDLRHVRTIAGVPTLSSLCLVYPDGSGGNLTTDDAASASVSADDVQAVEPLLSALGTGGVVVAMPEVPLAARRELLELGSRHACLRVASFTSAEMTEVAAIGILDSVDLLGINADEARHMAAALRMPQAPSDEPEAAIRSLAEALSRRHPRLRLTVTAGSAGSWCWDGRELRHEPVIPVAVVSTAGAGDAHLAGTVAGLARGLDLPAAHRLGVVLAAASVTSPHTIHPAVTPELLAGIAEGREHPESQ